MTASLLDKSLVYVTGKGGVGKTTIAAAIGLAAAARGRRTIVCEVSHQDRVSRAFARQGVREEVEVELEHDLWAITIDPEQALREWLAGQLGGTPVRLLARSHAFQYFVAAAPGAKELVTIGKVWELAQAKRWDRHNPRIYDTVVVDAPASGHGLAMLTTPRTFGEIARVGPIRRQAFKIRDMLADPARTGYVAVALPEEMPVNETLELERASGRRRSAGPRRDRGQRHVARALLDGRRDAAAGSRRQRAPARAQGALRAALTAYERARAQRSHLRRLRRGDRRRSSPSRTCSSRTWASRNGGGSGRNWSASYEPRTRARSRRGGRPDPRATAAEAAAEAVAEMRIRCPTRGNRRLEGLLAAVNADRQVKAWWQVAQVNADRLGMSDHSWVHIQIVVNIALRLCRLLARRGRRAGAGARLRHGRARRRGHDRRGGAPPLRGMAIHRTDHETYSLFLARRQAAARCWRRLRRARALGRSPPRRCTRSSATAAAASR